MKYFAYLCTYKESFTTLLSKRMDSTHITGKQLLFAYCITDGVLDEMTEEQQSSIISIIESLLSEGEDAISERLLSRENSISERLLSGEDANENKSIFVCFDRKN